MKYKQLDPNWIVGFIDGEGCFGVDKHVQKTAMFGLQIQVELVIVQHEKSKFILEYIQEYFGCGSITVNRRDKTSVRWQYRIKSTEKIVNTFIPFFDKYRLRTTKALEYRRWRRIALLLNQKDYLKTRSNVLHVLDLAEKLRIRSAYNKESYKNRKPSEVEKLIEKLREDERLDYICFRSKTTV